MPVQKSRPGTSRVAPRDARRQPTHPGLLLSELCDHTGLTRAELARRLGISRQHLYDVLQGHRPVSPIMAVRFSRFLSHPDPELWLRMQAAHDLWRAERDTDVSKIVPFSRDERSTSS